MPSVADLLKQAADAPGSSPPGESGQPQPSDPSEQTPTGPKVGVNRDGRSGKGGGKDSEQESSSEKEKQEEPISIDFEGIHERVVPFPVNEGIYGGIAATLGTAIHQLLDMPIQYLTIAVLGMGKW